jgi:hypothetical protein
MARTAWEYLFIDGEHEKDDWRARQSNGSELKDWKHGPAIHDFANDLGRQGWELVWSQRVLVPVGMKTENSMRLVFKRPVSDGQ